MHEPINRTLTPISINRRIELRQKSDFVALSLQLERNLKGDDTAVGHAPEEIWAAWLDQQDILPE